MYRYTPWPQEMRGNYQAIYNELLRIQAMLETCLAENELDNPYLFDPLLNQTKKRILRIKPYAEEILLYAPEGQGPPPRWLRITKELIRLLSIIYSELDSPDLDRKIDENRFPEVVFLTKNILQVVRQLQNELQSVPLEESRILITQSGFKEIVLVK